jgi:hypothetical protein
MASSEPRPSEASHKGRKLHRSANQLKRNAACLPCRRRRIKCDAGKPNCSSCVRNFHFLQRTQPDEERDAKGVQCTYEDADSGDDSEDKLPKKRKASVEEEKGLDEATDTVQRLEARVGGLDLTAAADLFQRSCRPLFWLPPIHLHLKPALLTRLYLFSAMGLRQPMPLPPTLWQA